jgi:hypothetical protein
MRSLITSLFTLAYCLVLIGDFGAPQMVHNKASAFSMRKPRDRRLSEDRRSIP